MYELSFLVTLTIADDADDKLIDGQRVLVGRVPLYTPSLAMWRGHLYYASFHLLRSSSTSPTLETSRRSYPAALEAVTSLHLLRSSEAVLYSPCILRLRRDTSLHLLRSSSTSPTLETSRCSYPAAFEAVTSLHLLRSSEAVLYSPCILRLRRDTSLHLLRSSSTSPTLETSRCSYPAAFEAVTSLHLLRSSEAVLYSPCILRLRRDTSLHLLRSSSTSPTLETSRRSYPAALEAVPYSPAHPRSRKSGFSISRICHLHSTYVRLQSVRDLEAFMASQIYQENLLNQLNL
ncbi:hypothetical protein GGU11DRAFT_751906 [Lentinula aff. detonsa]|nr:hypothetical protein GGU11DRAFT_751906 [Lentinula aff. detonsa]